MFKSSYVYLILYHVPLLSIIVFGFIPGCPGTTLCVENPDEAAAQAGLLAICVCTTSSGISPIIGGCCTQNSDCISGNCDTSTDVNPNGGINYRCAPATSGIEVEPL